MQLPTSAPENIIDTLEPAALPVQDFPLVAVLVGAATVALVVLGVYAWRRRHRRPASESLEQMARRKLGELATRTAPERRAFHAELAGILAQYAEQRLGLRGTRLTSGEIVRAFRGNGVMSAAWLERLEGLLRACDHAKFAPDADEAWDPAPSVAQCRALLDELAARYAASPRLASPWEKWTVSET